MYCNNSRSEISMLSFLESKHTDYHKCLLQSDYLMKDSSFIFYVEYLYISNPIIFCKNIKVEKQYE
jgi:CDP-glycerol glycerophosphotransferase (TagB/SpsB family)